MLTQLGMIRANFTTSEEGEAYSKEEENGSACQHSSPDDNRQEGEAWSDEPRYEEILHYEPWRVRNLDREIVMEEVGGGHQQSSPKEGAVHQG